MEGGRGLGDRRVIPPGSLATLPLRPLRSARIDSLHGAGPPHVLLEGADLGLGLLGIPAVAIAEDRGQAVPASVDAAEVVAAELLPGGRDESARQPPMGLDLGPVPDILLNQAPLRVVRVRRSYARGR